MAKVGIIGGSGLYELEGLENISEESLLTPFGQPSGNFVQGKLQGIDVVFLPRHGRGHNISPGDVNYRANIFGMRTLGVDAIISVSACGSLREEYKPLDFVVPDQLVDRTCKRDSTFFEDGIVAHVSFADPFCPEIRGILLKSSRELALTVHDGGTYLTMEGPQFSTRAESQLHRQWGMDIIGMTNATEAKLAREAEIAYATLAAVTDFDCWHPDYGSVTVEMILANLQKNTSNARRILQVAIPRVGLLDQFGNVGALKNAIVTAPEHIAENKRKELAALAHKYLG